MLSFFQFHYRNQCLQINGRSRLFQWNLNGFTQSRIILIKEIFHIIHQGRVCETFIFYIKQSGLNQSPNIILISESDRNAVETLRQITYIDFTFHLWIGT